jgi:hypothetical protein
MKTISINKQKIGISISLERCLRILKGSNFVAPKDSFQTGRGRHQNTELPQGVCYGDHIWKSNFLNLYGFTEVSKIELRYALSENKIPKILTDRKAYEFFKRNPRRHSVVVGNPRKINSLLNKLDSLNGFRTFSSQYKLLEDAYFEQRQK